MVTKKKTTKRLANLRKQPAFLVGLSFFVLGCVGAVWSLMQVPKVALSRVFSSDVTAFAEISIDQNIMHDWNQAFPATDLPGFLRSFAGDQFEIDFEEDVFSWIGSKVGIGFLEKGDFVIAAKYRNKKKAEQFFQSFALEGESLETKDISGGELMTPAFSSDIAMGFYRGWALWASSRSALEEMLEVDENLADNENYQTIREDMPGNSKVFFFAESGAFTESLAQKDPSYKPLYQALSQTLPAFGVGLDFDEEALSFHTKFLSAEGVFEKRDIARDSNQTMPELAQFAPQDALFFMNGYDLYGKYLHTKEFLENFHPQFSVIFDGVLRALSRQYFGSEFDLEKDLLSQMHGQYAFLLNFEDALSPFVNVTLITGFGGADIEQNLSHLHNVIHSAQSQFSVIERSIKMPDGTTREELIAQDEKSVPIQKQEYENLTYFTAENKAYEKQFSYGFFEGYFVFSTHESGLKSVINSYLSGSESLAQNADFRESVLFRYSPSESYGFFNLNKLSDSLELLIETENEETFLSWTNLLRSAGRNMTFSRKVFPTEIFWTGTIFWK